MWEDRSHFWIRPGQHFEAFLLQRKIIISSCLGPSKPASKCRLWTGWGGGEMQQTSGRGIPTRRHCFISPHLQMDDIFSLFSKFFQHLAFLNGWSSPYSSTSFDIWCSLNVPPSAHVVQCKKQEQRHTKIWWFYERKGKALIGSWQVWSEHTNSGLGVNALIAGWKWTC